MALENYLSRPDLSIKQKLWQIHWVFVILLCITAGIGSAMLYSAAGGDMEPWASKHLARFFVGIFVMLVVAIIDIRAWLRYSYLLYVISLILLASVEFYGTIGMGAQRWISLSYISLQPSELMKIALILALARYFHGGSLEDYASLRFLIIPILLVLAPAILVLRQPDLGTAIMLLIASGSIFFLVGVKFSIFVLAFFTVIISIPLGWQFLHAYQKQRVLTFLNPETDPLGSGYHIIQSKIALGSGGLFGKGFMQGTQGHLSFLPEMQTDFIFTMLAEEFGMIGGAGLLGLYSLILLYGIALSLSSRNQFGRLVGAGVTATFFIYIFINVAMVMGLVPVVGVPLPLISYGGTAMLTILFGFGLLLSVWIHREVIIGQRGSDDLDY